MYENQIVHQNPNFSLFVLHNPFVNQGSKTLLHIQQIYILI